MGSSLLVDWALYLDESGDTRPHSLPLAHGQSPVFALSGVALPIDKWRKYDREYLYLKWQFFENEIDKSSKRREQWEFKGKRAIAPRNAKSERLKNFTYKTLDLIKRHNGTLFAVDFLKNHKNPMASSSMYTVALQVIAETFNIFLREKNVLGIVIIDSRMAHATPGRGLDYTVAASLLSYVFGHETGRELKQLVESPLFVDSSLTAGVQIADILAAIKYASTYCHYLAPDGAVLEKGYLDYTHVKTFWTPFHDLGFVSDKKYEGYVKYGLRTFDHREEDAK